MFLREISNNYDEKQDQRAEYLLMNIIQYLQHICRIQRSLQIGEFLEGGFQFDCAACSVPY